MNKAIPSILLALASPVFAATAAVTAPVGFTTGPNGKIPYTTPVGAVTEHLHPGMNLIGLRLHQSAMAVGRIGAIGSDFAELAGMPAGAELAPKPAMVAGKSYVLEITSGAKAGVIQEITTWQGLRLKLPDDLAAAGVKTGDTFTLRQAATLNSVFDPRGTGLRAGANVATADAVFIPQGAAFGDFRACFILRAPGIPAIWVDAATLKPVGDLPLVYPDGLVVRIMGTEGLDLVFAGEIKPGPTRSVVKPGLNLIATPYPARDHLQALGLDNDLTRSDHLQAADHVWVADAFDGSFTIYFLAQDGHWINASKHEPVAAHIPVGSAILIDRKGPAALFSLGD